jgi:hypothetical protein
VPFAVDATSDIRSLTLDRGGKPVERVRVAHTPVALEAQRPGAYTIRETGLGVSREARVAVNTAEAPPGEPVDLLSASVGKGASAPVSQAWWFLAGALFVLALEWAYWISLRRRARL